MSSRIKRSTGLPSLELDCLACANKRLDKRLMVWGGIGFQVPKEIEPCPHIYRFGVESPKHGDLIMNPPPDFFGQKLSCFIDTAKLNGVQNICQKPTLCPPAHGLAFKHNFFGP